MKHRCTWETPFSLDLRLGAEDACSPDEIRERPSRITLTLHAGYVLSFGSALLQFHQHIVVCVIVEIAQLVGLAGGKEERFALLVLTVAHVAIDGRQLDPAASHRH